MKNNPLTLDQAKAILRDRGWSYRRVARPDGPLNVSYQHLSEVLNARRQSRRLLRAIAALPSSK